MDYYPPSEWIPEEGEYFTVGPGGEGYIWKCEKVGEDEVFGTYKDGIREKTFDVDDTEFYHTRPFDKRHD